MKNCQCISLFGGRREGGGELLISIQQMSHLLFLSGGTDVPLWETYRMGESLLILNNYWIRFLWYPE